jgi:branched-chain amino acid transport system substrate-binding protein
MKTKRILAIGAVALGLALGQSNVIKIASVSPLSGPQAAGGDAAKQGAQLAVEQAQERFKGMGFDLQFAPQDDQATPDVGVAVAKRLINDADVLGVMGHVNSGVTIPASVVYKEVDLLAVCPTCTNPVVTDRGLTNMNRVCGRDDVQGPAGAEYAVKTLKKSRIVVIHDKTAYGQGIADQFQIRAKALGADVVSYVGTEEASNFQPLIIQIRALKPDLVYYGGVYDKGAVFLKQLRERGVTATFMGADGLDSPDLIRVAGKAAVGVVYTSTSGPVTAFKRSKEFSDAYNKRFSRLPEGNSVYGYDAALAVIGSIEAAIKANGGKKPSREQVSAAARTLKLEGITGPISFNAQGDRSTSTYFIIYMSKADYQTGPIIQKSIQVAPPTKAP